MSEKKGNAGLKWTRALLPVLFFAFTVGIAVPSEIYFGNEKEFFVGYGSVLPVIALAFAVLFLAGAGIVLLLRKKRKWLLVWLDFLFGFTLAFYLQQNLLNGELQQLNGAETGRNIWSPLALASLAVWLACLIVPHLVRKLRPRAQAAVRRYGSALLTVMQVGALVIMLVRSTGPAAPRFALTKKDELTVSPQGNIVVFVVDTLEAAWAEEQVNALDEHREALKDFTYFSNVVAGGAPTILGMPTLLTGEIYNPEVSIEKYMRDAYGQSTLFSDLAGNGYQVRLYTSDGYLIGAKGEEIANSEASCRYVIPDRKKFMKDLYTMTAYKGLPYQLKGPFTVYSGELTGNYRADEIGVEGYRIDDPLLFGEIRSQGMTLSESPKSFVLYHLFGAHGPYSMNENGDRVSPEETSRFEQVRGDFRMIEMYLEGMKALGVYDSSLVVITGDHGGEALYQNPAVYVKLPGSRQEQMAVNDAPLTFRNLRASFMETASGKANEAYGEGMFSEKAPSGGLRPHTFDAVLFKEVYGHSSEEEYGDVRYLTFEFGDPARDNSLIVRW